MLMKMDPEAIKKDAVKYLNSSKNAYLFCKDSAERYLQRHRGNLRMLINRPSAIISCCKEPFPGWCDSIPALGAIGFNAALGISSNFYLPNTHGDMIPADIVSNSILVTTCHAAKTLTPEFNVYHNTHNTVNPMLSHDFMNGMATYVKHSPFGRAIAHPQFRYFENDKVFKAVEFATATLPL